MENTDQATDGNELKFLIMIMIIMMIMIIYDYDSDWNLVDCVKLLYDQRTLMNSNPTSKNIRQKKLLKTNKSIEIVIDVLPSTRQIVLF